MNLKGYVSVRSPVPVSVQNLVLRDYCQRNGHKLSLADVEFLTDFKILEALRLGMDAFDGICAYSMWVMPPEFRWDHEKEIHYALESLVYPRDATRIADIWNVAKAVK